MSESYNDCLEAPDLTITLRVVRRRRWELGLQESTHSYEEWADRMRAPVVEWVSLDKIEYELAFEKTLDNVCR